VERSEEWIKCENVAEKKPEDIGDLSTTGIVNLVLAVMDSMIIS